MMDTGPAFPLFIFIFHFFCAVSTLIFRENCMSTGFARIMPSLVSNTTNYRFPPFLCFPSFPLSLLPFTFPFFFADRDTSHLVRSFSCHPITIHIPPNLTLTQSLLYIPCLAWHGSFFHSTCISSGSDHSFDCFAFYFRSHILYPRDSPTLFITCGRFLCHLLTLGTLYVNTYSTLRRDVHIYTTHQT